MRSRVLALFLAAIGLALIPAAAEAGHRRHHHSNGFYTNYQFYHRHYRSDFEYDRYAYYPSPRRYYPYYNSGYWRPTQELRYRRVYRPFAELPPYYQAWGHPRPIYKARKWHRYGSERHRHW
jgi:hypothetical protein